MAGTKLWCSEYSVGVDEIDAQHRSILMLCNDLHEAISEEREANSIGSILEKMVDHANAHFACEESYLQEHCEFDEHRLEHWNFIKKVMQYCRTVEEDRNAVSMDVYHYLVDWLDHHLREIDVNYFRDMALEKSPAG